MLREIYQLISRELGRKVHLISLPVGLVLFTCAIVRILSLGKISLTEKVQRMGEDRSCSHELATKDFGYSPINFEDGIKYEIEEYKKRLGPGWE